MSTWLFILLLWIAPAVALAVLLIRTSIRKANRHPEPKASDSSE